MKGRKEKKKEKIAFARSLPVCWRVFFLFFFSFFFLSADGGFLPLLQAGLAKTSVLIVGSDNASLLVSGFEFDVSPALRKSGINIFTTVNRSFFSVLHGSLFLPFSPPSFSFFSPFFYFFGGNIKVAADPERRPREH